MQSKCLLHPNEMLYDLCNITFLGDGVSIGASGRIVIEVPPELKRELHSLLAQDGLTLKQWFIQQAEDYISRSRQPLLFDEPNRS